MKKLTSKQALDIHANLILATGGTDGLHPKKLRFGT